MRAAVVRAPHRRNTASVAQAIAEGIGPGARAKAWRAEPAKVNR